MQAQGQVAQRLTSDQVTFFEREGYLIIEDLLTHEELQPVVNEISEAIDMQARRLVASGELSRLYDEYDFEHRLTKICDETDKVALGIWAGQLSGPAFFDLIRNPSLLDVAEQFCGPELIGSSLYRLRPKVPNNLISAVPWHQDSAYAEEFCDEHLMLTFWIALVDATEENGCMWVIPRTHQGGVLPHKNPRDGRPYLIIPKDRLPPDRPPVCVPVRKGGALLMTNRTPHASFDNRTDRVRYSIDIRYQSAQLPTNTQRYGYNRERQPHRRRPRKVLERRVRFFFLAGVWRGWTVVMKRIFNVVVSLIKGTVITFRTNPFLPVRPHIR